MAGSKSDLVDENQQVRLEQVMPIMQQFRQIDTCIECSAVKQFQVFECSPLFALFSHQLVMLKAGIGIMCTTCIINTIMCLPFLCDCVICIYNCRILMLSLKLLEMNMF